MYDDITNIKIKESNLLSTKSDSLNITMQNQKALNYFSIPLHRTTHNQIVP